MKICLRLWTGVIDNHEVKFSACLPTTVVLPLSSNQESIFHVTDIIFQLQWYNYTFIPLSSLLFLIRFWRFSTSDNGKTSKELSSTHYLPWKIMGDGKKSYSQNSVIVRMQNFLVIFVITTQCSRNMFHLRPWIHHQVLKDSKCELGLIKLLKYLIFSPLLKNDI